MKEYNEIRQMQQQRNAAAKQLTFLNCLNTKDCTFSTQNTGGGCMIDIIAFPNNNNIIVINEEIITMWEDENAFWDNDEEKLIFSATFCGRT